MTAKAVRIKIKLGSHPAAAPGVSYTPPLIPWRRVAATRQRTILAVGITLVIAAVAVWLILPKGEDSSVPSWVSDAREPSPSLDEIGVQDSAFTSSPSTQITNVESTPSSPALIASPPQSVELTPPTIANNIQRDQAASAAAVEQNSKPMESGIRNSETSTKLASETPAPGGTLTASPTMAGTVTETITSNNIVRAQLATKLNGLEPANSVANQIKAKARGTVRVYYFNELHGLKGKTVTHQWTHDGKIYANVSAEIKSNTWRMYSSKALNSTMLGEWKIQVTDDKGNVLATRHFAYN